MELRELKEGIKEAMQIWSLGWKDPLEEKTANYWSMEIPGTEGLGGLQSEVKWSESHSVESDSLWPQGLYSSWKSLGQNTRVGSLSLLQGIFPTQASRIAGGYFTAEPQGKPRTPVYGVAKS